MMAQNGSAIPLYAFASKENQLISRKPGFDTDTPWSLILAWDRALLKMFNITVVASVPPTIIARIIGLTMLAIASGRLAPAVQVKRQ
jgi:hypothetical protein